MWYFINIQQGLAPAGLDFTNEFSLFGVGLIGVIWLSVGALVVMAVEHSRSRTTLLKSEDPLPLPDYREAA